MHKFDRSNNTKASIMKYFNLLLISISIIVLSSCNCIEGHGPTISQSYTIEEVEGLILDISANVKINNNKSSEVIISAQENILEVIQLEEKGGVLRVRSNVPCITKSDVMIEMSMETIKKLHLRGSGVIDCYGTFINDEVELKIDGSGEIHLDNEANDIEISINGSGDIYLEGNADFMDINVNGSGKLRAYDLELEDCEVVINGSGDCYLNVKDDLDVVVRGSGDVFYTGSPNISTRISGSGSVKRK